MTDSLNETGASSSQTAASDVLDIEGLRNRCMGNLALVERLLKTFQERIPADVAAMGGALQEGNAQEVARVAHRVKGSSASMSAGRLAGAAAEIEVAGRAGLVEELPARIESFRDEWEKYLHCVMTLLSADNAASDGNSPARHDVAS